ncbi:MAG: glycosyltransferase [Roseovarius sp.]|nr:glycosyltransferase [Roseovarius sp.]
MAQSNPVSKWHFPKRVAYVVNHSFPYSSDGYAVRTHEVARALGAEGHDVLVINRPGRPWDIEGFSAKTVVPSEQVVDGVRYIFLPMHVEAAMNRRARLREAERVLMAAFEVFRPGAVMAVSNWENAEPAQYAARRWGVPFFYEQRGFWEMSRAACDEGYAQTDDYALSRDAELRIAREAEVVFTLNRAMREELLRRGVEAEKVFLVPNGVSKPRAIPKGITRETVGCQSQHLLGYVGSLNEYEGCSDLLKLIARLRADQLDVGLLVVGSSAPKGLIGSEQAAPTETRLRAEVRELGLQGFVHFVPQVAQDKIGAYYSMLDAVIMPRCRTTMTELVAPLKPYAAATYGVPVFMTDMPPLDEIAEDIHGSLFPEGDIETLAAMVRETLLKGGHPATMNSLKPAVQWGLRIQPMSRALRTVAQKDTSIKDVLGELGTPENQEPMGKKGWFDASVIPQVALGVAPQDERVLTIGPCAHLGQNVAQTVLTRANLLPELATGSPGRFIIDWVGIAAEPGEWEGLWSIQNMRLNRQIMNACSIALDRGWHIQVVGPVYRSKAPLFRTVRAVMEEIHPQTGVALQEIAE